MKKNMIVFAIMLCLTSINVFAQEVRGIETRRVIYEGSDYSCGNEYYGWELTNRNSCTVSLDITLSFQGGVFGTDYDVTSVPPQIVKTQSILLNAGETYIFKREEHHSTRVKCNDSGYDISQYYIEYKAYKLQ